MIGEKPPSSSCEVYGGAHLTERHTSQRIVTNSADAPRAPSAEEIGELRVSGTVIDRAPGGWDTLPALAKRFHRARESLDTLIAPQRLARPEWFAIRKKATAGSIAEHFHPALIALVEQQLEEAPSEGWLPATSFGPLITEIAAATSRIHPELARPYVAPDGPARGQLILYYAPEFFIAMQQWLEVQQQRAFPLGTTPADLEAAFGTPSYAAPFPKNKETRRTFGEANRAPYETIEEIADACDALVTKIREDLLEDPHRQRRVRAAAATTIRDLERSRLEDDED